jgi:hypothetical protein
MVDLALLIDPLAGWQQPQILKVDGPELLIATKAPRRQTCHRINPQQVPTWRA